MSGFVPQIINSSACNAWPDGGQGRSAGKRGHGDCCVEDREDSHMGVYSREERTKVQCKARKQENHVASCRCSISHVHDVVANLDVVKKGIVDSNGFGGLLLFPAVRQIDRQFSIWLMSRVDPCEHEIVVDSFRRIRFTKKDIAAVFGIPSCGKRVLEDGVATKETINYVCSKYLGISGKDGRSVKVIRQLLERNYLSEMSHEEVDSFKVAFVVYIMSTLLAPGAKYDNAAVDYWNAIADPGLISSYDWSDYVLHKLLDSIFKVKADLSNGCKALNLTGCSLFLQVLYLDSIDLGVWKWSILCYPEYDALQLID